MRFKVLPEPVAALDAVAAVRVAVPLVPDDETSCCARLVRRTDVGSQDHAKEWLTFLRALRLVEETDGQYRRSPTGDADGAAAGLAAPLDPDAVRASFRERIYLADEILTVLESTGDPLDVDAVFEQVRDRLPQWERRRHTDPDAVWRERVRRILEWAVVLDLASRTDGAYERST